MSQFTKFSAELNITFAFEASVELKRDLWRVTKEFTYFVGSEDSGVAVTIPAGYLTDGASVPRALWSIVPPWGSYGQAVVIHDFLCEYLTVMDNGKLRQISRITADKILVEAMQVLQVPEDTLCKIELAVRGYRVVNRIDKAVWHKDKARLEAAWAASQNTL